MRGMFAVLAACLLVLCFSGCQQAKPKKITCADVIAAYEDAGYEVFYSDSVTEGATWLCYVSAEKQDSGETVYFYFFEENAAAQTYAESRQWNVVLWLYSFAMSDPIWVSTKTYGNIAYEYTDSDLIEPFNHLIK